MIETAVILGGCGDIGLATCQELIKETTIKSVAIIDVADETRACEVLKSTDKGEFWHHQCAVEDEAALREVFAKIKKDLGRIDVVINAAGVVDEQSAMRTLSINTIGTINSTLLAVELMRKDKGGYGGQIINIGSVASYTPTIRTPIYTASKYAVLGFTKSLAHPDFESITGVTLSVVCPGSTRTAITQYVSKQPPLFPELKETYKAFSSNSPRQNPIDVARCILHAINVNENGSVWEVVMGEIKKINA